MMSNENNGASRKKGIIIAVVAAAVAVVAVGTFVLMHGGTTGGGDSTEGTLSSEKNDGDGNGNGSNASSSNATNTGTSQSGSSGGSSTQGNAGNSSTSHDASTATTQVMPDVAKSSMSTLLGALDFDDSDIVDKTEADNSFSSDYANILSGTRQDTEGASHLRSALSQLRDTNVSSEVTKTVGDHLYITTETTGTTAKGNKGTVTTESVFNSRSRRYVMLKLDSFQIFKSNPNGSTTSIDGLMYSE